MNFTEIEIKQLQRRVCGNCGQPDWNALDTYYNSKEYAEFHKQQEELLFQLTKQVGELPIKYKGE